MGAFADELRTWLPPTMVLPEAFAAPLDFVGLCAIGYAEISGEMMDVFDLPPGPNCNNSAPFV